MSFAIKMLHEDIDGTVTLEMTTYDGTKAYVSFARELLGREMTFADALNVIYHELKAGSLILQKGRNPDLSELQQGIEGNLGALNGMNRGNVS